METGCTLIYRGVSFLHSGWRGILETKSLDIRQKTELVRRLELQWTWRTASVLSKGSLVLYIDRELEDLTIFKPSV